MRGPFENAHEFSLCGPLPSEKKRPPNGAKMFYPVNLVKVLPEEVHLYLQDNGFSGTIPVALGQLPSIAEVRKGYSK